jgi:trans-2,3-dihydro-3-hydroxyanthranilate isomerase
LKEIQVFHVDAFTNQSFGGNVAGVVPNAEGLTVTEMQKIAKELNLSETAFVFPSEKQDADVRVRYFTPSAEIDFCGHATIGLSWILATEYGWLHKADVIRLETNIGIVPVEWTTEKGQLSLVTMTQVSPMVKSIDLEMNDLCQLIGICVDQLDDQYPVRLAYTGNWHLLIPIKTRETVDQAKPNMTELAKLNKELQVSTTHLFTFDSFEGATLYTRDFAPAVGIPEDPVTGSANGALAGYLVLEGILDPKKEHQFKIAQGHTVGRPGWVDIRIGLLAEGPVIKVGGTAVRTIAGTLTF